MNVNVKLIQSVGRVTNGMLLKKEEKVSAMTPTKEDISFVKKNSSTTVGTQLAMAKYVLLKMKPIVPIESPLNYTCTFTLATL